ncbi:MAG: hypothetical protein R3325_00290 [Thermoanaerobaculia bacterium]|nr:hypothetical protein [Thermoanaerobaculia bacterium]
MRGVDSTIPQRVSAGPLLRAPDHLEDGGLRKEKVLRLEGARVVFADYGLLQHDFPHLRDRRLLEGHPRLRRLDIAARRGEIRKLLDIWLLRHAAVISRSQAGQTRVNTPIETGGPALAYRPTRYGRALVRSVPGAGGRGAGGLLDLKGTGVGPNARPSLAGAHTNGLHYLGCAFLDMVAQWVIDEIFHRALPDLASVPTYAVLDTGFDMKWRPDPSQSSPAAIQVRRAHRRAVKAIELPTLGSELQALYLEIELLLRNYGITSSTPGTTLALKESDGKLEVRYAGTVKKKLRDEQIEELRRVGRTSGGPRQFDGVNIQIARQSDDDPARAQLVDFGHYKFHERFENPLLSLVRGQTMKWGGAIWPEDPDFVRPDDRLRVPAPFTARKKSWPEIRDGTCLPFPNGSQLEVTAFSLARRFRLGEVDGDEVLARLRWFVDQAVARW